MAKLFRELSYLKMENIWSIVEFALEEKEYMEIKRNDICIYDRHIETEYRKGELILTNFRLVWSDQNSKSMIFEIPLHCISKINFISSTIFNSSKIAIFFKNDGARSKKDDPFIKFSFRSSGCEEFYASLDHFLKINSWDTRRSDESQHSHTLSSLKQFDVPSMGIIGIHQKINSKHESNIKLISEGFKDFASLMEKGAELVELARNISKSLAECQVDMNQDQVQKLMIQLLSLGIDDPVTRKASDSEEEYLLKLSHEISHILMMKFNEGIEMLSLTDAYCIINRARGIELISPDDLLSCLPYLEQFEPPIRSITFDSGFRGLTLQCDNDIIDSVAMKVSRRLRSTFIILIFLTTFPIDISANVDRKMLKESRFSNFYANSYSTNNMNN